ncbi:putative protein [BD1-7 clade bacterium]|uniref:Outer membrane lipoprotein-sorting protein n=1 Tax=BD1-7 clade bacterium TaxID=2029982 RepID=A0A5S9QU46_9GAMM|nr:putative protein [BD1-7 clade bacterium]
MNMKSIVAGSVVSLLAALPLVTQAAVSQQEAKKLGNELTPMGAEKAGNAAGTIPEWTGSMSGVPAGLPYMGSGDVYPNPYAKDKILYTVTAQNAPKYDALLTEGEKALLAKYPDTFSIPVYPSHRDARFSQLTERRTEWNSVNTVLVNGVDGLQNYTGGAPFPIPKNGAEAMWNARTIHPHPTIVGELDDVAVYLNGDRQMRRQELVSEFPYSYPNNKIGDTEAQIGTNAGLVHVTVTKPARQKGQMTVVHEALDQVKNSRQAWVYIPGSRRVRRAPTVGYDTPDGPGGLVTVDDALGFNGAMDRYDWTLVGKAEKLIPYHNYRFDTPEADYKQLLMPGHANPDYMRYELHRVWIVEANLKAGARHVYAKRRFYIDEDSWQIALIESYDGRGDLWKVGILNTLYDFAIKGYVARVQMYHDLNSGAYVATRLVNETAQPNLMATPKGIKYYSPSNLRKMGTR